MRLDGYLGVGDQYDALNYPSDDLFRDSSEEMSHADE
jgi:hypothetical protein